MRRLVVVLGAGGCALLGGVLWLRRRFLIVTVRGRSMTPTFQPGDRVLLDRWAGRGGHGDVVTLRMPGYGMDEVAVGSRLDRRDGGLFLKRVAAVAGDPLPDGVPDADGSGVVPPGTLALLGDHVNSTDSRAWGCVPRDRVVGVVVRRLSRSG